MYEGKERGGGARLLWEVMEELVSYSVDAGGLLVERNEGIKVVGGCWFSGIGNGL